METKEDSGLIDILAMQQRANAAEAERQAGLASQAAAAPLGSERFAERYESPLSEPPPAFSRDNTSSLDADAFAASLGGGWKQKLTSSRLLLAGAGGFVALVIGIVALTGGDDQATAAAKAEAARPVAAAAAPAPPPAAAVPAPPPVEAAPAPAPIAAKTTTPAKADKHHRGAKQRRTAPRVKMTKVQSSGT